MSDFVDLHVHILPGIDDGASAWDESLQMARDASSHGTSCVVATPHLDLDSPAVEPSQVMELAKDLSVRAEQAGIPLTILPGFEMRMGVTLNEEAKRGTDLSPFTLNRSGKYLLFDLPMSEVPLVALEACFSLRLRGILPILAHPERNLELATKSSLLRSFLDAGLLIQIDSGSLLGRYGRRAKKTATMLVKERRVHVVASDAHTAGSAIDLEPAEAIIKALGGSRYADLLLKHNPALICAGEPLSERA